MRLIIISFLTLAGCADFPAFDSPAFQPGSTATYPRIQAIDGLIICALGPSTGTATAVPLAGGPDPLAARVAALKARAAILRGAPINEETRARLAGG